MSVEPLDFERIEKKWQEKWEKEHVFDATPDEREKFFLNIPYPYMNGFLHIGRLFTYLRGEVLARYKRMKGYNVLFPFAFHCTGSPIVNAARRIANGEQKQIAILRNMGVEDELIPRFADPEFWTQYFPEKTTEHLKSMGMSIDWRRSFITTSLNPHYDAFIKWQFRKLKEGNFVIKGAHPVIWCKECQNAVSDHSRLEGEGETPQEFTLLKFAFGDGYIIAATLRPETVYGQTNIWVDPDYEYVRARVGGEEWIISRECAEKLSDQEKDVEVIGSVKGRELIGHTARAPAIEKNIIILPSAFCDPCKGTGIVTSVPSDAPDDWIGLHDLQNDPEELEKYGLSHEDIASIEPIAIIRSKGWGPLPAKEICEKMGIESQLDREKLTKAKKEIYKSGFYTGVMNDNCGEYAGMSVEDAKEAIKQMLIDQGRADKMYEPSGEVVCRCLSPCTVKIVRDQYFLAYGDPEWKEKTHQALDRMELYPPLIRKQFEYVIDWLNNWACTRKVGLGTTLPWDEEWMIESLSDSTIYMAYYTIAHKIDEIDPADVDDAFFDYVFLGIGSAKDVASRIKKDASFVEGLRDEFNYWYPFDLRTSGKDLIQNHLTFCLFNHTAIFPPHHWPRAMGVNGWLMIDKEKMSSSKGNVYTSCDVCERYGTDVVRIGLMYSGEGVDDPNWETSFVETMGEKLSSWYHFATTMYGTGRRGEMQFIDLWFETVMLSIMKDVEEALEGMMYRSAIQRGYFDLHRALKWYQRRTADHHCELMDRFIEVQTQILSLFCPHVAEEIWEAIGMDGFISVSEWTSPWKAPDETMIYAEEFLKSVIDDIKEIIRVAKIEQPSNVYIYTSPQWKWEAARVAQEEGDMKSAMARLMQDEDMRKHGKKVSKFLASVMKHKSAAHDIDECGILNEAKQFIETEVGAPVTIDSDYDPESKREHAQPGRVAIYIE
ncbi:leucine--tRNA ligase [archaeon]|nr:MAG: leucine--tRNA ligase [archaeon]